MFSRLSSRDLKTQDGTHSLNNLMVLTVQGDYMFFPNQAKNTISVVPNGTLLVPLGPGLSRRLRGTHTCSVEEMTQPTWPASLCTRLSAEPAMWCWARTPQC